MADGQKKDPSGFIAESLGPGSIRPLCVKDRNSMVSTSTLFAGTMIPIYLDFRMLLRALSAIILEARSSSRRWTL
jgi:hypothetical protein